MGWLSWLSPAGILLALQSIGCYTPPTAKKFLSKGDHPQRRSFFSETLSSNSLEGNPFLMKHLSSLASGL